MNRLKSFISVTITIGITRLPSRHRYTTLSIRIWSGRELVFIYDAYSYRERSLAQVHIHDGAHQKNIVNAETEGYQQASNVKLSTAYTPSKISFSPPYTSHKKPLSCSNHWQQRSSQHGAPRPAGHIRRPHPTL